MLFSQILPGESLLLGAPLQGAPGGLVGGWVTQGAGDAGSMYFGVETCLGCILAVTMHVD